MYSLGPSLTIKNARAAFEAGLRAIAGGQTQFDLGELKEVDSAAIATLLAWQRSARRQGKPLDFLNLPTNLRALAEAFGVAELLPAAAGEARTDLPHH